MNFKKMLTTNWALPAHGGGGGSTEVESSQQQRTLTYGSKLLLWYYRVYKEKAEHDQKLLNIMFHYNPGELKLQISFSTSHATTNARDNRRTTRTRATTTTTTTATARFFLPRNFVVRQRR